MLKINCDIGERGRAHPIDDKLMTLIDIANIACGGHAGDTASINYYVDLAQRNNVLISSHLSYPDRENFGRKKIAITDSELIHSLDQQYQLLPSGKIKFHGALYHESSHNPQLVPLIVEWLIANEIKVIIAPPQSLLAQQALLRNIAVWHEGFIERGYRIIDGRLDLIPRGMSGAELTSIGAAVHQFEQLRAGCLLIDNQPVTTRFDTACIHSDSPIALELAQTLKEQR